MAPMRKPTDKQLASAERLRRQLADAEAIVAQVKAKLARLECKLSGEPPAETGLDMLWKAALPIARLRSSKLQCRQEWERIPVQDRPKVQQAIDALYQWNRCHEWKKDGNQFVPGLHRWIKLRQWENVPDDVREAASRYRNTPKPLPKPTGDEITDAAEIARILSVKAPRMNS